MIYQTVWGALAPAFLGRSGAEVAPAPPTTRAISQLSTSSHDLFAAIP